MWPDRIIKANNSNPTLRCFPDSIRRKIEGALKICRRHQSPKTEKAIDIFLRNQVQQRLDGDSLLQVNQAQIVKIIRLMTMMIED